MDIELKKIKKYYGEDMMHFCKNYFPTVLESHGQLFNTLSNTFAPNKALLSDITSKNLIGEFIEFILNSDNKESGLIINNNSPFEIFKSIGYTLYECKNKSDVEKFKKYYEPGEELCTFRDSARVEKCYVFFAVKDDVDSIKRKNFKKPKREDLYGTSVMSIQFTKGRNNYLSIKNRYNHSVKNPDATYANNLENITPGLTYSFQKYYGFNIESNTNHFTDSLITHLKYTRASDHKYYRYNYEINNIYYCDNNVIIEDHKLIDEFASNKERYIVMDYFILDLKEKEVFSIDEKLNDSFMDTLDYDFKKIEISKDKNNKVITLNIDEDKNIVIKLDKHNRIIEYKNDYIESIPNKFMYLNKVLERVSLSNAKTIGFDFLTSNSKLKEINIKNAHSIGSKFLYENDSLEKISLDKAEVINNGFLYRNTVLSHINADNLKIISDYFLGSNTSLTEFKSENLENIGSNFMQFNMALTKIYLPKVKKIGKNFLANNSKLGALKFPELQIVGNGFLENSFSLRKIDLPKVIKIGNDFCMHSDNITLVNMPNLLEMGNNFLLTNKRLKEINLPSVKIIGDNFCMHNTIIDKVSLYSLIVVGDNFLRNNLSLDYIYLPIVKHIGSSFLYNNRKIKKASFGHLEVLPITFMFNNRLLNSIDAPYVSASLDKNIFIYNRHARGYFTGLIKENDKSNKQMSKIRIKELKKHK